MAYDEPMKKGVPGQSDLKTRKLDFDEEIYNAGNSGKNQERTDIFSEGKDYLGVDDIDRIRRKRLITQTQGRKK